MTLKLNSNDLVASMWYITTALFRCSDHQVVAGPFSTREDATVAREAIEVSTGNMTYWIDQAPNIVMRFDQ